MVISARKHRRLQWRTALGILLIIIGIVAGVGAFLLYRQWTLVPAPPPAALTSRAVPSTAVVTPEQISRYTVPADDPKYITIPAITVDTTRVRKLGLLPSGAIAVPSNINDTGWYDGSARPGQDGAMFIYGHVSSWTANGVFYNLKKLKPGDAITVTRGNNKTDTYTVVTTKVYPHDNVNMKQVLSPIQVNRPGLNLMTCTGKVISGTSEFDQRLVVFASLRR